MKKNTKSKRILTSLLSVTVLLSSIVCPCFVSAQTQIDEEIELLEAEIELLEAETEDEIL